MIEVKSQELDDLELRLRLVASGKEGLGKSAVAKLLRLADQLRDISILLSTHAYCADADGNGAARCTSWEAADVVSSKIAAGK